MTAVPKQAQKRLTKEFQALQNNPAPFILAKPLESNILIWHFVITGPPETLYAGGEYHGKVIFPPEYPFKPPGIKILTPNGNGFLIRGRFRTNFRICLSMSDYHPATWNPSWSVATILTGLLSFMLEETETAGSIRTSTIQKLNFAQSSYSWNRNQTIFKEVFPELLDKEIPTTFGMALVSGPTAREQAEDEQQLHTESSYSLKYFLLAFPVLFAYLVLVKISERTLP